MILLTNDNTNNNSAFNFKDLAEWLFTLSGLDFAIIGSVTGILIGSNLTVNQQNTIGNFLELVGQVLLTINAQEITRNSIINNTNNISLKDLNDKINYLLNEIEKLKNN